jgi:Ca-activated chloride channel family protein
VAHDIRNQYIIGYKPSNPQSRGGYRTVKVEARSSGYGKLQVRTRSGYYAEQQRAAKQEP